MSHLFSRAPEEAPVAVRGEGAHIWDTNGNDYLDAAGGAIVVGIGHGDQEVANALGGAAAALAFTHATQFRSLEAEAYADELAPLLPLSDARIYPISGGSDAVEAALKLARTYHLARGDTERQVLISRWGSYHGNTRGALDVSGREPWRQPYLPWLGLARHQPAVYEYRCSLPTHPDSCGQRHADLLAQTIEEIGSNRVAAFIAEPIVGAALGAVAPPDDYWPAIRRVCDQHGVLLIADEVMTGFGRTGRWFGCDHWSVRPDILATAKGVCSGYWPMGLLCCSGQVYETVASTGFVHGGTFSHSRVGAGVARIVLRKLKEMDLVTQSRLKGEDLLADLREVLGVNPHVGEIRGRGLMVGVEVVKNRDSKEPFPRGMRIAESIARECRARGVLIYPSSGCANGTDGDVVMMGPPFVIKRSELHMAAEVTALAIEAATSSALATSVSE